MSHLLSFWEHVEELRKTLIKIGCLVLIAWVLTLSFQKPLFHFFLKPFQNSALEITVIEKKQLFSKKTQLYSLPFGAKILTPNILPTNGKIELSENQLVEIEIPRKNFTLFNPLEGFFTTVKLTFWTAILVSSPLSLLFILQFVTPALKRFQKKTILIFLFLSSLFIFIGIAFAYKITLPFVAKFFKDFNATLGENLWSLQKTVDFSLCLILSHALVFELYVALLFLIHFRIFKYRALKKLRRLVIVASLIIAAILTPPDVISQILLATPMYILYESALLYASFRVRARVRERDDVSRFFQRLHNKST